MILNIILIVTNDFKNRMNRVKRNVTDKNYSVYTNADKISFCLMQ